MFLFSLYNTIDSYCEANKSRVGNSPKNQASKFPFSCWTHGGGRKGRSRERESKRNVGGWLQLGNKHHQSSSSSHLVENGAGFPGPRHHHRRQKKQHEFSWMRKVHYLEHLEQFGAIREGLHRKRSSSSQSGLLGVCLPIWYRRGR